jgi:eukaryotic-like serine/threonine-protein kinase
VTSMPVLGGRYRLLSRIGHGGMSIVWRAYDQVLDRTVAVKLLASGVTEVGIGREMIRAEARTAAQLSHPHICQVYDYGESRTESGDHVAYIVMELLSGSTLMERLRAGPMPVREATRVCAQVASALAAAHGSGLVHRDVKPGNIMLTPAGPKVVDFGIAASAGTPDLPAPDGETQGTPGYLAPERLAGGEVTAASDVYALGLVLYRMLSATAPWSAETARRMMADRRYQEPAPLPPVAGLPEAVADLCRRCLAEDPRERPTAQEVAQLLGEAAGWRPPRAGAQPVEQPAPPASDAAELTAPIARARDAMVLQGIGRWLLKEDRRPPRRHTRDERYRRRLVMLASVLMATVAGVAGGIWVAGGPADLPESGAAEAPVEPSVESPERRPVGAGSPLAPEPDPTGSTQPPDAPTGPGSGGPGTEDQGPPPPGGADPGTEPGTPEAAADPDPVEEVVETGGGTVLARCVRNRASVEPLDLAPGYEVVEQTQGPGVVRAAIVLGSADEEIRVGVRCRRGQPESTVTVD